MADSVLEQMQQRVEMHFDTLKEGRDTSSFPIFALEHGLNKIELQKIRSMLQSSASRHQPPSRYWLLWVIYATELGYDYEGDEYWGSFEAQTPGWEYRHRASIKDWFLKFQKAYGGVIPSGPWAEHFSIIAWPITHAILPLYLQRQFAKLLYDLRFQFVSRASLMHNSIGRLLAIHAFQATKRFKAFLEQEELTGQIALALLGGEPSEGTLIHPLTLKRITTDLEKVRIAREWLDETQRVVSDRFRGIGRGTIPVVPRPTPKPRDRLATSGLVIRPNVLLRHVGSGTWSAFLDIKSFRPVAALSAEIHSFLKSTRCRLNGAEDIKPAGWLLSGDRRGVLRSWPDPTSPLIRFERSNPKMDHLLESECRLDSGPIWLFRIGADGVAHHITSRIVRPGFEYIVIVTTKLSQEALDLVTPCDLACKSVLGCYRLLMPPSVSAQMTARLVGMGLHVTRTIRVWPAGLPGRGWDGEGSSEWLTTESPCFGITYDHPVESLSFRLNDRPEELIHTGRVEYPLFVRLKPMPAGTHRLTVKAKRTAELEGVAPTPAAEGFVQLAVRDPEPWTPGVTSHSGMIVRVDPDDANLDAFWRNKVGLSVNGPQGFSATLHATLQSADGRKILSEQVGDPMDLPITPEAWSKRFGHFLDDKTRAWKYMEAASCTLMIRGETLGTCTLRFEHEPAPVRWGIRSLRHEVTVKLIDDSGQDQTEPDISLYSMERPFVPVQPLTLDIARSDYVVNPPGYLFVASHGEHRDAVLVSTLPAQQGLQGLQIESSFPGLSRGVHALANYFRLLRLWCGARLCGFLAPLRHHQVMADAVEALRALLCGENWAKAERLFREQPDSRPWSILAALVDSQTGFGDVLVGRLAEEDAMRQTATWFVNAAAQHNVCRDRALSEFALHLANDEPLAVAEVADRPDLERLLTKLADNPAILRAARLLILLNSTLGHTPSVTPTSRFST